MTIRAKKTPPAPAAASAPRWTYTLAAVVAAGGLLWLVASFIITKAEAPKVAPAAIKQNAISDGGVAINAADSARVSVGDKTPASPNPNASSVRAAANQTARAASGGVAINATGSAQTTVTRP